MFTLLDGRTHLYQWDIDRQVIVNDSTISEVHFSNETDVYSLVVEVVDGIANIPNILLQDSFPIKVYAYCADGYTKVEKTFKVISRTKPSDYAYTETEIKSYEYLEEKLDEIEAKGFSEETVTNAVTNHFEKYPIEIDFTDDNTGNVRAAINIIPDAEEGSY